MNFTTEIINFVFFKAVSLLKSDFGPGCNYVYLTFDLVGLSVFFNSEPIGLSLFDL